MQPPGRCARNGRQIAELTLLRAKLVRARVEDGDHVGEQLQNTFDEFVAMLNGDIRQAQLQHYCFDTCCEGQNREVAIARMVRVIMEAIFGGLGTNLPSTTRWYTFSPHLARQTAGVLFHSVLPQVARQVLSADPAAAGDDEDNFHAHANKKKRTAQEFLSEGTQAAETLGIALLGTAPLDQLSHRLQHLDYHRGSICELITSSREGLLKHTQISLWQVANPWHESPKSDELSALWRSLRATGSNMEHITDLARATCVGLAAAVWCRFELKCPEYF